MKIGKWGNSLAVRLPEVLMEQLGLGAASTLALEVRDGALVMRPSRPSLKDMLATCTPKKMTGTDEDWQWLGSVAVGNENI